MGRIKLLGNENWVEAPKEMTNEEIIDENIKDIITLIIRHRGHCKEETDPIGQEQLGELIEQVKKSEREKTIRDVKEVYLKANEDINNVQRKLDPKVDNAFYVEGFKEGTRVMREKIKSRLNQLSQ